MSTNTNAHGPAGDVPLSEDAQRMYEAVREVADKRAVIEQAKGMLMFVYGVDEDAAFDVLRLQSQQNNVKLRRIAEQIVKDLAELARRRPARERLAGDGLLLTAHERITNRAAVRRDGQPPAGP